MKLVHIILNIVIFHFIKPIESFTSLGPFVKQASKGAHLDQADKLFQKTGEEAFKFLKKLEEERIRKFKERICAICEEEYMFIRTAGKKINWLHLRIDKGLTDS